MPYVKTGKKVGRPRKLGVSKSAESEPTLPKPSTDKRVETVFKKVIEDASVLAAAQFDGGGTPEAAPVATKESLERRVNRRLNVLDRYLTDERLEQLLLGSSLKEIGVYEGIMLDKALLLKGSPTVIIGNEDRAAMDSVLPRLLSELKRRKMITSVSERKLEFSEPT